jgi:filamentous hemagglutinin
MSARELSELKALMAVEKQTGQKISAESLEKLMLDSGSKGNWSKELNNP